MSRKLAYLHTVPGLAALFTDLSRELLPDDVEVFHIADEMLLKVVLAQGGLSPFIFRRVAEHVVAAEAAGANLIQLTCSSISPCAEAARPMVGVPVLKIDEAMVDRALQLGTRIGVAATAPTTLKPTTDLLIEQARRAGKPVAVEAVLCEGAYAELFAGHPEAHDCIVREYLEGLAARSDVIVLAQASMARVVDSLPPAERPVPILSSPRLAVERVCEVLERASG